MNFKLLEDRHYQTYDSQDISRNKSIIFSNSNLAKVAFLALIILSILSCGSGDDEDDQKPISLNSQGALRLQIDGDDFYPDPSDGYQSINAVLEIPANPSDTTYYIFTLQGVDGIEGRRYRSIIAFLYFQDFAMIKSGFKYDFQEGASCGASCKNITGILLVNVNGYGAKDFNSTEFGSFNMEITNIDKSSQTISGTLSGTAYDGIREQEIKITNGAMTNLRYLID